mgnify:FL=1
MNNGCPEIPGEAAHQLIREWEEQQLQTKEKHIRFGLRKIMAEEMTTEEARVWLRECLRTGELNSETLSAWIGNQFPTFPAEWVGSVLPVETPDQDQIPWNRRARRAHSQAKGGNLVNLFSGATNWSKRPNVIDVELDRGQDLRNDALYSYLLELAKARKVSGVVGGPPCRSWSRLRLRGGQDGDGGPRQIRDRHGPQFWRREGITAEEEALCKNDAVLLLRTLVLYVVAQASFDLHEQQT